MEDICGVDVFQTAESLIEERLEVSVGKRLAGPNLLVGWVIKCSCCERDGSTDDGVQISFHEFFL